MEVSRKKLLILSLVLSVSAGVQAAAGDQVPSLQALAAEALFSNEYIDLTKLHESERRILMDPLIKQHGSPEKAFEYAVTCKKWLAVEPLVRFYGVDPDKVEIKLPHFNYVNHCVKHAAWQGYIDGIKHLVACGANVKKKDFEKFIKAIEAEL